MLTSLSRNHHHSVVHLEISPHLKGQSGRNSGEASSTGTSEPEMIVSHEAPKFINITDVRTEAPPPTAQVPTKQQQQVRQANGPGDDRWNCRECGNVVERRQLVTCMLCQMTDCKMCIEHCQQCQKGPNMPSNHNRTLFKLQTRTRTTVE